MKRSLTVVCVLTGALAVAFAAGAFLGFWYRIYYAGVICAIMTLVALWMLVGSVLREELYLRFEQKFNALEYAGAKAVLDKASHNHFFYPVYRVIVHQLYIKVYFALDDTASAARHVECLRHMGGVGWKYRTAFFVCIANLDWDDVSAAQTEYAEFSHDCKSSQIYREQLDLLDAVFARLNGEAACVPESAKSSPYPVVHRVIDKYLLS